MSPIENDGTGFVNGYPLPNVRVTCIRRSGMEIVGRLGFKPDAMFRRADRLHWLNDDDKFIDVKSDPIVAWKEITQ